ncbi:MAG: hypothetical protein HYY18_07880 [Planctomycetes bacterium]|nr:hypothetical protein [Planctomycetota bacterium]
MPSKGDVEFGNLAIREKATTRERVEECLKYQGEVEAEGQATTLDRVMLQKGYLTEPQVFDLNKKQGRRVVFCTKCQMKLNVAGLAVGQKVKCPRCSTVNITPEKIAFELVVKGKPVPGGGKPEDVPSKPETVRVQVKPPAPPIEVGEVGEKPPPAPMSPVPPPVPEAKAPEPAPEPPPPPPATSEGKGKKFATRRYGKR